MGHGVKLSTLRPQLSAFRQHSTLSSPLPAPRSMPHAPCPALFPEYLHSAEHYINLNIQAGRIGIITAAGVS